MDTGLGWGGVCVCVCVCVCVGGWSGHSLEASDTSRRLGGGELVMDQG